MVMKPCVCEGSNDKCRYCSGSGYVSDLTPLPSATPHHNPYLGKQLAPSPYAAGEPLREGDEILTEFISAQRERRRVEQARKDEARKRALVGAAFLFLLALIILFVVSLFRQ